MSLPPVPSRTRTRITGVCPEARAWAMARVIRTHPASVWLVVIEEARIADAFGEDIALFHHTLGGRAPLEILQFPEAQADSRDMRESFNAASDRLAVLSHLRGLGSAGRTHDNAAAKETPPLVVLTTPGALLQPVPAMDDFTSRETTVSSSGAPGFQSLLELLRSYDYDSEAVCEAPGQYAVRGGIVDVYPITAHQPYRLDYFGDTLEEIRALDPVTQRSSEKIDRITLTAAPKMHAITPQASLLDYLNANARIALIEPKALEEVLDLLETKPEEPSGRAGLPFLMTLAKSDLPLFGIGDLDLTTNLFADPTHEETWDTESLIHHRSSAEQNLIAHERLEAEDSARRDFLEKVLAWKKEGFAIDFIISKEGEEQRTRELIEEDATLKKLQPRFVRGTVNDGFRVAWRDGSASPPDEPSSHGSSG
jgi:transcription-repair coupling factor (superfamily II helicase)